MATVNSIPSSDVASYDYVIVGGGTAGCVIASRLAEYLPRMRILLIEGGPSDFMDDRVLLLKDWLKMLGGEFDYDYGTTEQPMGEWKRSAARRKKVERRSTNCSRKQPHPALACQSPRRLLQPQHAHLVPAVRARPESLGVAGRQGLVL